MLVLLMLAVSAGGVVNRPVANMYAGPSEDRDVVSQAIYGANVKILEDKDGWTHVQTPDEYKGWTRSSDLVRAQQPYAQKGRVARVDNLFANVYRETSITKHAPLMTLPYETRLEVIAEPEAAAGRWLQVRLADDRAGWIQRGDVSFDMRNLTAPETIAVAKRFMGLPYLWGGTSTFGYDCSGYTQMLCRRRGIIIPRDAGPQAQWSGVTAVKRAELEAGDLLYFGPSEQKITHTGMYIGEGKFIHATSNTHPVIQISELGNAYWSKLLVGCRRLK